MSTKRASHRQALRQLLVDRHGIGNMRQERGQVIHVEHLIDEILRINDRFNHNPSIDEALNSGDGSYKS